MAHDLGHPPFGHLAEQELHELCSAQGVEDGFEGNAQSFRVISRLSVSDALDEESQPPPQGLNLTRGTLNATLKYPWLFGQNQERPRKWGAYQEEVDVFKWVREEQTGSQGRTVAAEIMDWADDITYAVHDVVDFYVAGKIPLDRIAGVHGDTELREFFDVLVERCPDLSPRRAELEDALTGILGYFSIRGRYTGSREQARQLWQYTSVLISRYASQTTLIEKQDEVAFAPMLPEHHDEVAMLKQLTWHYVILDPDLGTQQRGQRRIIREVFQILVEASEIQMDHRALFPAMVRQAIQEATGRRGRVRAIADYIASMTERELSRLHRRLFGRTVVLV